MMVMSTLFGIPSNSNKLSEIVKYACMHGQICMHFDVQRPDQWLDHACRFGSHANSHAGVQFDPLMQHVDHTEFLRWFSPPLKCTYPIFARSPPHSSHTCGRKLGWATQTDMHTQIWCNLRHKRVPNLHAECFEVWTCRFDNACMHI